MAVADFVVPDHGGQRPGGFTRQGKARYAAVLQDLDHFSPLAPVSHQVADDGLDLLIADLNDFPGNAFIVHEKRRDKVDIDAVKIVICHHGIQAGAIMSSRTGGQDIYRVVDGCLGKQRFGQHFPGFI